MPSSFYPDIPRKLDDIFDKMSMDAQEDRYDSIDEILADLYEAEEVMSLMDNRSGVLFMTDPIDHGELGGIAASAVGQGVGLSESSVSEVSEVSEISEVDEDEEHEESEAEETGEAEESEAEEASEAEEVDEAGEDADPDDVLDKLDKYGGMFEEEA